ncbi:MAG: hypothetical protein Fues2KO_32710 [Fuerstiella sp.]
MVTKKNWQPRCLWATFVVWGVVAFCGQVFAQQSGPEQPGLDKVQREFFEKSVRPILIQHCYDCHAADEVNGGLRLDSKPGWQDGGDSGAVIVPGKPDQSLLIEAVRYSNRDLQMPPQNALTKDQIAILEKWVAMGAPDPRTERPTEHAAGPTGMSVEDGRRFWSFRPVADPAVPEVAQSEFVKHPLDAFVLAQLEAAGLQPAPPADRRELIRRASYDLIGLPPTPEEVDAFVADERPEAWAELVDRLLSSPQYGVRWGRHWLDVARYADSNGLDENIAFGNAWRYRDYVVDSFNRDKPFDQFVREQVAGDLLPYANRETRTATGFLNLGAKVLAEPDIDKLVMDTIDEQLDTTGKAFMGLTLGCARCHDHKFDPIRQRDYYSLAAIFRSTESFAEDRMGAIKFWNEHNFASEEEREAMKSVDDQLKELKSAASSFRNAKIAEVRQAAQQHAADYLVAATLISPDTSLAEITAIAEPRNLHPRILHHCRRHLQFHSADPFFADWHRLVAQGGSEAVDAHYRPLIERTMRAWEMAKQADPKVKALPDTSLEQVRSAIFDPSGFLAVPPKVDYALDPESFAQYMELEEKARIFESQAPDLPSAMGVADGEVRATLPIHIRGSHLNHGEPVPREFPAVLHVSSTRPVFPDQQSGRLQLAEWLSSTQHPLTARVFVNRVWGWHFGRALVKSTENFGVLGDRPTHPELLDWLARRFMQSGWSIKQLHREILHSATYQISGTHPQADLCQKTDPENLLLWKFRLQRLEAEQIRDALLATSGRLDQKLGGKKVPLRNRQFVFNHTSVDHTKYDSLRRSLYLPIIRNNLYSLFEQFDYPDPTMPTGRRNSTTVAPQALLLMNSELVMDSADALAKRLLQQADETDRIRTAYRVTLGREPTEEETARVINFVGELTSESITATGVSAESTQRAWSLFCQSLYASNEFLYVK